MTNEQIFGYRGASGPAASNIQTPYEIPVYADGDPVLFSGPLSIHLEYTGIVSVSSMGVGRGHQAILTHTGEADPQWPLSVILPDNYLFVQGKRMVYRLTSISENEIYLEALVPANATTSTKTGTAIDLEAGKTGYYEGGVETAFTLGSIQEVGGRAVISSTAASAPAIAGATATNDYANRFTNGGPNHITVERLSATAVIYWV